MKRISEPLDVLRFSTPEGEKVIPVAQIRAVLRKAPSSPEGSHIGHVFFAPPAVGVEMRNGQILWSDGESDWYYSGHPSRVGR